MTLTSKKKNGVKRDQRIQTVTEKSQRLKPTADPPGVVCTGEASPVTPNNNVLIFFVENPEVLIGNVHQKMQENM